MLSTIVMPEANWGSRELNDVIQPVRSEVEHPRFELLEPRSVSMKGLGEVEVREIHNTGPWIPSVSAEDRAVAAVKFLEDNGRNWPRTSSPPMSVPWIPRWRPSTCRRPARRP